MEFQTQIERKIFGRHVIGRFSECVGLIASIYLYSLHVFNVIPPCFRGSSCAELTNGPSSEIVGVPVSLIGVIGFSVLLCLSALPSTLGGQRSRKLNNLHFRVASLGLAFSVSLVTYGIVFKHSVCPWCLAVFLSILVSQRLSSKQLRTESNNFNLAILSVCLLSLSGIAGAGIYLRQKVVSNRVQVSSAKLMTIGAFELLGESGRNQADLSRNKDSIVGFYLPGCSSCLQSMRMIKRQLEADPNLYFKARFVSIEDTASNGATAYLQAIANSPKGITSVLGYFNETNPDFSVGSMRSYLERVHVAAPSNRQIFTASSLVKANNRLIKKLAVMGFPVVIRVNAMTAPHEINPITLGEYSDDE